MASLGKEIARLRHDRGYPTQKVFATRLSEVGYRATRGYVAGVESGNFDPSFAFLIAAEQVLRVPRGSLLGIAIRKHAEAFCERLGLHFDEYLQMLSAVPPSPWKVTRRHRSGTPYAPRMAA